MFFSRPTPALPPRDFPLLLRREWRVDNTPQARRLRALALIEGKPKTLPAPYKFADE